MLWLRLIAARMPFLPYHLGQARENDILDVLLLRAVCYLAERYLVAEIDTTPESAISCG
jgi:hypothetical protein